MKRLTEREPYWLGGEFWIDARNPDKEEIDDVYERLKYFEDMEEQGRLLILPCKPGQIVYVLRQSWNGWNIDKRKFSYSMIGKFGKTVFLKEKEAEEALKKKK